MEGPGICPGLLSGKLGGPPDDLFELLVAHFSQNFRERFGGAARCIALEAMVHFHHFQIESRAEDLGRLTGEPEQRIDAGGIIRGQHHRDLRALAGDRRTIFTGVSGGADYECFAMFGT